eukprot:COSAG06_NODE_6143_length_3088_cov_5.821010_2_plen_56_part_00
MGKALKKVRFQVRSLNKSTATIDGAQVRLIYYDRFVASTAAGAVIVLSCGRFITR